MIQIYTISYRIYDESYDYYFKHRRYVFWCLWAFGVELFVNTDMIESYAVTTKFGVYETSIICWVWL